MRHTDHVCGILKALLRDLSANAHARPSSHATTVHDYTIHHGKNFVKAECSREVLEGRESCTCADGKGFANAGQVRARPSSKHLALANELEHPPRVVNDLAIELGTSVP